jgi:6-pyruvoyltetrahydropterin/6-carboxytetrahydropterin synthase
MVEIDGALSADSWVFDFSEVKRLIRELVAPLDHRFLLAVQNEHLVVSRSDGSLDIRFQDRRYVLPASDVAELEIDNTTAERLAEWLASRLASELARRGAIHLMSIRVGIEEMPGQTGWFTLSLG